MACTSMPSLRDEILPILDITQRQREDAEAVARRWRSARTSSSHSARHVARMTSPHLPATAHADSPGPLRESLRDDARYSSVPLVELGRLMQALSPKEAGELLDTLSRHRAVLHLVLEADRAGAVLLPDSLRKALAAVLVVAPAAMGARTL
jgi:hypothetical protein